MRSDVLTRELMELRDRINKLSNEQRDILLDFVDPQPEPQAAQVATKKKRKPRSDSSKSQRASNMAVTLDKSRQQRETKTVRCIHEIDDNGGLMPCGDFEDSAIHDKSMGYEGYHEFVAPSVQAAGVSGD
jgi:hypothetical protein